MTRDDAIRKVNSLTFSISVGEGPWLVDALVELGLLKLEATKPTLWELLRDNGVSLDKAQAICNSALINGVTVPRGPQETASE